VTVFLDTNVLISALTTRGLSSDFRRQAVKPSTIPSPRISWKTVTTSGRFKSYSDTGMSAPQWCVPTSSIEGVEGSVARRMNAERLQIVCGPNWNRLTAAAVFVGQSQAMENLDKLLNRQENRGVHDS